MRKILLLLLLLTTSVFADTYRVHYSIRGSGRDITVQAESSAEARRVVMDMFPGAVVTGVQPGQEMIDINCAVAPAHHHVRCPIR